ncbi:MAG: glycine cleavage system aminomethyltransferase GcvT [Synergistaceae bacterium]|jgi:aminomethyltransferase|nr:glycine cleavage system aminomethyltransferase GcvT [Synergistaceae bacterium]
MEVEEGVSGRESGKRTSLYDCHKELGGKMVPFAGYMLPVQYSGVISEHMAVRTKAGLFDVSHMGEILIAGKSALPNLQRLLSNDFSDMPDGRVRYSLMCNESGGIVDDLVVYRFSEEKYILVVNAANREKDVAWLRDRVSGDAVMEDISGGLSQIALQGPASDGILSRLADPALIPEKYYTFVDDVSVDGVKCVLSQTGYTGEKGYELYMPNTDAPKLWRKLLQAGADLGLAPAGLGARDTLRLEAGMPLYGHEMTDGVTPFEAGLASAVKMNKDDFVGKSALAGKENPTRRRVGLRVTGRGIAREDETVYACGAAIGRTTSGTHCPFLGAAVAMALVDGTAAQIGAGVEVDVRGRMVAAEVVPLPFYKRAR